MEAVQQGDFCVNPFSRVFPPHGSAKCVNTLCSRSVASVTLALKMFIYADFRTSQALKSHLLYNFYNKRGCSTKLVGQPLAVFPDAHNSLCISSYIPYCPHNPYNLPGIVFDTRVCSRAFP